MKTGTIIAFPEKSLKGKDLSGLKTTRLRVDGDICIGVPTANMGEVCDAIGISERSVSKVRTSYEGIYLARFSQNGHDTKDKPKVNDHDKLKRKYMELCGYNRKAERVKKLKQEVAKLDSGIEKCQQQLVSFLRQAEEKRQQLQIVAGTDEASLTRFGDEFERLSDHPDLEKIEIVGDKIIVYTKPIVISYRGTDYNIGRFKVSINTHGKERCVKMVNLTRTVGDRWGDGRGTHHPHVDAYGVPCLGNIQEVIPNMIAEHQYPAVIAACIQYLKSYENSSDYGPYSIIEDWPVAKKQK